MAKDGNDEWSGTLPAPNPGKTDGPFATLERTRQGIRQAKAATRGDALAFVVQIRAGTYFLPKTLVFGPADSGSEKAPVIYEAYPGEKPVLSGGERISGWKLAEGNRWEAQLPEVALGHWYFSQLYVNGQRRFRPVLPKNGYYVFAGEIAPGATDRPDRFLYRVGQIDTKWQNLSDVEITPFHWWTMDRMRLKAVDAVNRVATLTGSTLNRERAQLSPSAWYRIENVREALSRPGEWYLDRPTGTLFCLTAPGEDIATEEVIAPRLSQVIRFNGDPVKQTFVTHIILRGLTVMHAGWNAPAKGFSYPQADAGVDGAISARGMTDCSFENCEISHVGNYAIELTEGCHDNRIEGCEMTDLGAGGIKVGPTQIGQAPDEKLLCSHTIIRDNLIAHGGRVQPAAVGVWIGHASYNVIEHNRIADFYYSGISVGWSFHVVPGAAHHNIIANNRITDIGQDVLGDLGGIYTLGEQPGTVVTGNVIHDVKGARYGGTGIYLDAGSAEITVENNLVTGCEDCCIHQNYGRDNTVRNNIFAFAREGQLRVGDQEKSRGLLTFARNIFYWRDSILLFGQVLDERNRFHNNLYWQEGKTAPDWFAAAHPQPNWTRLNEGSVAADPEFLAAEKGDFRLRPDSPAMKMGFQPFDSSKAGRLAKPDEDPGVVRSAFPPAPSEPKLDRNEGFFADFEGMVPGEFPPQFCEPEQGGANVGATTEAAADGKMSFKMANAPPNNRARGKMQVALRPQLDCGKVVNSFDLRLTPNSCARIYWLNAAVVYRSTAAGPALTVDTNGTLSAGGVKLAKLPPNRWVHIKIVCHLGAAATGHYSVSLSLPGESKVRHFDGLACDPRFNRLEWLGLSSPGSGQEAFYIDNFKLARE